MAVVALIGIGVSAYAAQKKEETKTSPAPSASTTKSPAFASKTAAVIKKHLDMVKAAQAKMK